MDGCMDYSRARLRRIHLFHGDMVHGIENFDDLKLIASRYASHLKLDPNDYEGSLQQYRHYMTISYISGYLIEKTLSVDNLFVMMMISPRSE